MSSDFEGIRVSNDTRTIKPGEYYVPFVGEKLDGHDFIDEALKKGAAGVIEPEELYKLAKEKLEKYKTTVIGVTGSVGKTTMKEALGTVLSEKFNVLHSSGNLNTLLGLSMEIINKLEETHDIFVAEIGMDRAGEIKETCTFIKPHIGVVTIISQVHMENLGSQEAITRAKGEMLESMDESGVAFINSLDKNSEPLFGIGVCAKRKYNDVKVVLPEGCDLLGSHVSSLYSGVLSVGKHLGLSKKQINAGFTKIKNEKGRLNLLLGKNGSKIIDDSYNSSPPAAEVALDVLANFPGKNKIAVLGDMLELGEKELEAHAAIVALAKTKANEIYVVGNLMKKVSKGLKHFDSWKEVCDYFESSIQLKKGDVVLVKASQGIRLEKLVKVLLDNPQKAKELLVRQTPNWDV